MHRSQNNRGAGGITIGIGIIGALGSQVFDLNGFFNGLNARQTVDIQMGGIDRRQSAGKAWAGTRHSRDG